MQNEVNIQRSKLLPGGMLHIEFLDGSSYLYSLQELADIIAAQQSAQPAVLCTCLHEVGFYLNFNSFGVSLQNRNAWEVERLRQAVRIRNASRLAV